MKKIETKKQNPLSLIEPIANALGYKLIKKEKSYEEEKPINAKELENMTEDELKLKILSLTEDIVAENKRMNDIKNELLEQFKKEGPNEFTRHLFSGTAVPNNRLNIFSKRLHDLQLQKGYIELLIKEKRKLRLISTANDNIKSIDIRQGPVGLIMHVEID